MIQFRYAPVARIWLRSIAAAGTVGLAAYLVLTRVLLPDGLRFAVWILAFPGLVLTILLGAAGDGGGFGDVRDFVVIPLGCGLIWGTLLFGLRLIIQRWARDVAA